MKRLLDILLTLLILIPLGLLVLGVIWLAVRLGSKGPAMFKQRRAGWRGRPFTMLKFRTMRTEVDPYGHSPHGGDDPRLTKIGRWPGTSTRTVRDASPLPRAIGLTSPTRYTGSSCSVR